MRFLIIGILIYPSLIYAGASNNRFKSFWQDFWSGFKNTISIIRDGNDIPAIGNPDCGQEGQPACLGDIEYWETGWKGCDYGLKKVWNWKDGRSYCYNDTRRSADIPAWLVKATNFQRKLLKQRVLARNIFIGAHNTQAPSKTTSFVKSGFGTMVINQIYSITDLLNMGVRSLSVDVHHVNRTFRVCHGTEKHWGCGIRSRFFASWLEELKIWLEKPENQQEIVHLHFQVEIDREQTTEMFKTIKYFLGDYLDFIPEDMKRYELPNEKATSFILKGQRIILQTEMRGTSFVNDSNDQGLRVFTNSIADPGYPGSLANNFNPESCQIYSKWGYPDHHSVKGTKKLIWLQEEDVAIISMDNIITKVYESFIQKDGDGDKKISAYELRKATDCYITLIYLDKITPSKLFPTIWTWDIGEPLKWGKGNNCTLLKGNGRWKSESCNNKYRFACINIFDNYDLRITTSSESWENGQRACENSFGNKFAFALPIDPFQNKKLVEQIGEDNIWLNYASPGIYPLGLEADTERQWEYTIRPVVSAKYVTEMNDNSVRQFSYIDNDQGRDNQIWKFEKLENSLFFTISNSATRNCLKATGVELASGIEVPVTTAQFQSQVIESSDEIVETELTEGVESNQIYTEECTLDDSQQWFMSYQGDGRYQIINKKFRTCLEVMGDEDSKLEDLSPLMSFACEEVEDHYFKLETP